MDILRVASGLSGLLSLRSGGKTPSALNETVVPTVDLRDLYVADQLDAVLCQDVAPAIGTRNLLDFSTGLIETVPPGEFWFMHGFTGFCAVAAATAISFVLGIRPRSTTAGPIYFGRRDPGLANETVQQTADSIYGRILAPGTSFCIGVESITGAPGTVFANIWFSRLKA